MKVSGLLVLILLLAGCASVEPDSAFAIPTCSSDRECTAKWNAAEAWIYHNTGRSVVEKTDTMMRTNMDQSPGNYLSIRVYREHVEGDTWRITAEMYCARKVGCHPSPWEATRLFNRSVNQSWIHIGKHRRGEPTGK